MNVMDTWKANNPRRYYSGDLIFGSPMCFLKELPIKPKEGDVVVDDQKWQASVYKNNDWRVVSLDIFGEHHS